jgi:hypothetical protein
MPGGLGLRLDAELAQGGVVEDAALSKILRLLEASQCALSVRPDNAVDCTIVMAQALQLELRAHGDEQTLVGGGAARCHGGGWPTPLCRAAGA